MKKRDNLCAWVDLLTVPDGGTARTPATAKQSEALFLSVFSVANPISFE